MNGQCHAWKMSNVYISVLGCFLLGLATAKRYCGEFQIETPNVRELAVEKHCTVNLTIRLNTSECTNITEIRIEVSKLSTSTTKESGHFMPQCNVWYIKNTCIGKHYSDIQCTCLNTTTGLTFIFTKIVTASDITSWKLSSEGKEAEDVILHFVITDKTTGNIAMPSDDTSTKEITQKEDVTTPIHLETDTWTIQTTRETRPTSNNENDDKHTTVTIIHHALGGAIAFLVVIALLMCILVMRISRKENTQIGLKNEESTNEHVNKRACPDNHLNPRRIELGPNVDAMLFIKRCPETPVYAQNVSEGYLNPDLTLVRCDPPKVDDVYYVDIND